MGHRSTILAVDDDSDVLNLVRAILSRNGFQVHVAADGAEGLDRFHRHHHELCLVITDVVMPGMNGWELACAIRAIDASLPVLLISGYSDGHIKGDNMPGFPLVHKPFSATDLLNAVRAVVQNDGPRKPAQLNIYEGKSVAP